MTFNQYDPRALQEFREKVAETAKLREELEKLAERSHYAGDLGPAKNFLDELTLRTKELGNLRESLGPEGVLLAKYGVAVINDHTVSFVLPRGCSRIEILKEAQEVVKDMDLIATWQLTKWMQDPVFTSTTTTSERICIDGNLEGGIGVSREGQFTLLSSKGLELAKGEDLAVAFALHWVATREPLLRWDAEKLDQSYWARVDSGMCHFDQNGLWIGLEARGSYSSLGVAARIPTESTS